jgi:hypothetical protein
MTPEVIEQIAEATAQKLKDTRSCRFSDEEAQVVHGFGRALKEYKAGEKEIFVVIQLGKNLTEFLDRASKWVLWGLIIGALLLLLSGVLPKPWGAK